ncbi:MAG: flagellar biosynthetic protein FliQ [Candidatus Neomarinimicrobiota bacterium]|nr:flagellar biosynthesis protein FliQ [Candidatus Neomarinimicrobiota bacterium]MCD6100789.1 flagellar biosynthesis protein FliQ [Candidatus Neomarinimicrobiota bacterium]RKY47438.1 MAG: flagellar biosynthetic protein FliQ [Candidatus Neomarinimicrobiota bacterium]RKY49582.1 MAG: flagellar biosynthetic protein FliQ [Candidatus Neomarinimicrobiota bacterium]RKY51844.1 MAG: flagellar biosynthetic protein FliQ [Candidatus Neomarinimicrobiota bacterium]
MTTDYVIFLGRETLMTAIYILAPLLGSALMVGLAIAIFQAITSIHEMTLTFIPKMAIVGLVLLLLLPWYLNIIMDFVQEIYNQIPLMVE